MNNDNLLDLVSVFTAIFVNRPMYYVDCREMQKSTYRKFSGTSVKRRKEQERICQYFYWNSHPYRCRGFHCFDTDLQAKIRLYLRAVSSIILACSKSLVCDPCLSHRKKALSTSEVSFLTMGRYTNFSTSKVKVNFVRTSPLRHSGVDYTVLPANTPHLPLPRSSPEGATTE